MDITKEEAKVMLGLINQAFLDGFDDEELVELFEKLSEFVDE